MVAPRNGTVSLFAGGSFPVYTLSADHGRASACEGQYALYLPPVLTSGRPEAPPDSAPNALGTIVRSDGSRQVTYHGQPLYLFAGDVYWPGIPGIPGTAALDGTGLTTPWGTLNTGATGLRAGKLPGKPPRSEALAAWQAGGVDPRYWRRTRN